MCHPRDRLLRNGSFSCVKCWDTQSLCENDLNSNEGTNDLWVAYWAQRKWMWIAGGHFGPGRASTYKSLGVPSWTRMGFYEWLSLIKCLGIFRGIGALHGLFVKAAT